MSSRWKHLGVFTAPDGEFPAHKMHTVERVRWRADLHPGKDEPLFLSLLKYRMRKDRQPEWTGNLVSSHVDGYTGWHLPIIDLDIDHEYVASTSDGHAHLYLNWPVKWWRCVLLLIGLRAAGVIEQGNFWWSLRRGGMFVRRPRVRKTPDEELTYTYGMFFPLKKKT